VRAVARAPAKRRKGKGASRPRPFDAMGFTLPPELAAGEPPEARGLARDGVRMLVSHISGGQMLHSVFRDLPRHLSPGDLLVVNASATINGALTGRWEGGPRAGEPVVLHLSTPRPGGPPNQWVVELRQPTETGTLPLLTAAPASGCDSVPAAGPSCSSRMRRNDRPYPVPTVCGSGWPS
jgi:S-adenosylmethionine:tRNA ribosyltransferase-isomerase